MYLTNSKNMFIIEAMLLIIWTSKFIKNLGFHYLKRTLRGISNLQKLPQVVSANGGLLNLPLFFIDLPIKHERKPRWPFLIQLRMVQQNPFEKAADLKHKSAVSEHFNLQNMPPQRISLLDCFILQKVSHFHCFGISQLSNYCGCKMCCLAV